MIDSHGGVKQVSFLGNVIWFLCAGAWQGLAWFATGVLWCLSIVGIPGGRQCFKLSALSFCPFGREVEAGGGAVSFLLNLVWLAFSGWWLALASAGLGLLLCLTVVGIPFGLQCLKLARLALMPFGAKIVRVD